MKNLTEKQYQILTFVMDHPGCTTEQILWHVDHWQRDRWERARLTDARLQAAPWLWPSSCAHP
jgi:hypothetical protein